MQRPEFSSSDQCPGKSGQRFYFNKENISGKIRASSVSFPPILSDYFRDVAVDICDDRVWLSPHGAGRYSRGSHNLHWECV